MAFPTSWTTLEDTSRTYLQQNSASIARYFINLEQFSGVSTGIGEDEKIGNELIERVINSTNEVTNVSNAICVKDYYKNAQNKQCTDALAASIAFQLWTEPEAKEVFNTSEYFNSRNGEISKTGLYKRIRLEIANKESLLRKAEEDKKAGAAPNIPGEGTEKPESPADAIVAKVDLPVRTPTTPVQTEGVVLRQGLNNTYSVYEDSRNYQTQQFNSWILSWEPTQKVGIVKVPISKIISALGSEAFLQTDNSNPFQDATLFQVSDLIDFDKVTNRIFLPLASNKLILLKDFSIQRKNIQSAEITYGSRYFQVFAENFPDFTMQIDVVIFHDIAKKVKLFFDNVMKRISETSRYSGSLYMHDVLAEEIPAFDAVRLSNLVNTKELMRYRLLPRTIRTNRSADDPNMLKITIDGIVVEWEKQDQSDIKLTSNNLSGTRAPKENVGPSDDFPRTSGGSGSSSDKQLIGPKEKYSNSFTNVNLGNKALVKDELPNASLYAYSTQERVIKQFGNTLFKDNTDLKAEYSRVDKDNYNNLWNLVYLQRNVTPPTFDLSAEGKKELIQDTSEIYQQIATQLSNRYVANKKDDFYKNLYNSIVGRAVLDLEVPGNQHKNFKAGLARYLRGVGRQIGRSDFGEKLLSYKVFTQKEYEATLKSSSVLDDGDLDVTINQELLQ